MAVRGRCGHLVWPLIGLILIHFNAVDAVAVMSVDLGNEWIKIAIVSPGKPMEIVLNTDSARKTPHVVAFRDGERFFGEAALTTSTRFPDKAFHYLLDLIGKPFESDMVAQYQRRFPHMAIEKDNVTGGALFRQPDGETYTPIELLAMLLHKSRQYAELAAGEGVKIRDVVIAVPPYLTHTERYIVGKSAELAGLKVLQVLNGNTAVALNYGLFRTKDFAVNKTNRVMFFDMGASGTTATVVGYTIVETKEKGFTERIPKLTVLGLGHDGNLGGFEMQLRLRDHLAELFAEQRKVPLDKVLANKRAMSKLLKEAARVKRVLSANTAINAQVENVMDDKDLKAPVTRQKFEELCADLLGERIQAPVKKALAEAGVAMADIEYVILFGGNSRIPKVQEQLSLAVQGKELSKSVNSDEAAALGAAYQAAFLVKTFKIKPFNISDPYDPMKPIEVASPAAAAESTNETDQVVVGEGGEETKEPVAAEAEGKPAVEEAPAAEPFKPSMDIDSESFKAWQAKLKSLNKKDYERAKRESTRNTLESFVMEMRTILEDEQHTKEPKANAERQALISELDAASELLDGQPSLQELQDKLVKVRKSVGDFHQKLLQIKLDEIAKKERDSGHCSRPRLINLLLGRNEPKPKRPALLDPTKLEL